MYDAEETVFFSGANVDTQKQARIESLERLLEQYQSELNRVNTEGPISVLTNDNGKRTRPENTEGVEEFRRKIRILQNGMFSWYSINYRLNKIPSIGGGFAERHNSFKVPT